nr:hypothetical protein [Tanacetum cinerariifolium]
GLHQAPRAWYGTLFKYLLKNGFQRGTIDQTLFIRRDKENPWGKDKTGKDVDLHLYRSMIGSLMYLTASRPYIMFAPPGFQDLEFLAKVYKVEKAMYGLHQAPRAGMYGGATQDRKSTTGGCQFLGRRLITWQCKKQTIVATSTTKPEYVAADSCCRQVL